MTTHRFSQLIYTLLSRSNLSPRFSPEPAEDEGLTLIECLVAIVMVAMVMGAITPALVISVATRVQSQKANQALELAQSEIDRVRLSVERGEVTAATVATLLPPAATTVTDEKELATVAGPAYGSFNATPSTPSETRPVDIDGGGNDFAIQTFRTPGLVKGGVPVAFGMGVRVYAYEAVDAGGSGTLGTEDASLAITSGEGQRSRLPLATLYTTIAASEAGNSLCNYIEYLSTSASTPLGCD